MKNYLILILIPVLAVLSVGGCHTANLTRKAPVVVEDQTTASAPSVEEIELAKIILRPRYEAKPVKRDPFEPWFRVGSANFVADIGSDEISAVLGNLQYLGLVKIRDEYSALLKSDLARGVFKVNDKFNRFIISEIHEDRVLIKDGDRLVTLKRGDK